MSNYDDNGWEDDFDNLDALESGRWLPKWVMPVVGVGVVLILLVGGGWLIFGGDDEGDTATDNASDSDNPGFFSGILTSPTPTNTPIPVVDADQAHDALTKALNTWTVRQTFGTDCLAGVCNQRVSINITYLDDEVRQALALQRAIGKPLADVDTQRQDLNNRLQVNSMFPFLITVYVGGRTVPLRNDLYLGSVQRWRLQVSQQRHFTPADWDAFLFDYPIELTPETQYQGYLFFPHTDDQGTTTIDFNQDRSFAIEMQIPESYTSDREVLVWHYSLINPGTTPADTSYPTEDISLDEIKEITETIIDYLDDFIEEPQTVPTAIPSP